jgi:hypothetical protein
MVGEVRALTEKEVAAAYAGPALLANRFFINTGPSGARLAFAEQGSPDAEPQFRAAVILSYQDAIELVDVLKTMLGPIEAALATAPELKTEAGAPNAK